VARGDRPRRNRRVPSDPYGGYLTLLPSTRPAPLPVRFHPAVEEWFTEAFAAPTRAQQLGWPAIQAGQSSLVFAPTGSGKTLAAFLAAIDRLMFAPVPPKEARCRVLYVSPLRALAVDVERNLRAPTAGIARVAGLRGGDFHLPSLALRTGDTPADERARMLHTPPDILITTPESLFLILSSRARAMLASLEVVIVDEIHALVGTKRGAHLALSLERVSELARLPVQRIGLSATARPLEEVARFLGGAEGVRSPKPRPVTIVDAGARKAFDLKVEIPVEDMSRMGEVLAPGGAAAARDEVPEGPASAVARRSIWPAIHPRLLELVRAHRSTLLFVNSRRLAERLAAALNELAGEPVARAHHGSIAREQRVEMEDALKAGRLPAMVATSSLELGIDMGAIDLVVQIETPPSVASGMQRIGRASHQAEAVSRGIIFPKYRGDLLATAALTKAMTEGAVEETRVPANPLDVLAQHLVSAVAMGPRTVDDLFALVRRAAPFTGLGRTPFEGVLDMLSGRYPSDEFAELRPRLTWDRLRGTLKPREGVQRLVVANAGTIPDRGLYGVFLMDGDAPAGSVRRTPGRRVGELDEEMVFESRVGEVFVLGASSWRIAEITRDRVLVTPAPGEPGKMPFWKADRGARPAELGRAIGRLTRELVHAPREKALARLVTEHALDERAARNLIAYLDEQKEATGALPDDRTIVLERTRDEMGDWRLCLLSPWGGRIHAPWSLALEARLRATGDAEAQTVWSDDGIVIRIPDRDRPPDAAALVPEPEEVEDLVVRELGGSALFAAHFREAAARALLLPRRRPGLRTPLWMQRKRAADLLAVAARYPSFPLILEAYRECLKDVFDLPGFVDLLERVQRREVRLVTVDTGAPSPFSASLLFGYVSNYLYEGDAPLAERRAQALSVDQRQLRELLGESELRELLDPRSLLELEQALQGLEPGHRARSPDRLHDLFLRLGDLSPAEIAARVERPAHGGEDLADDPAALGQAFLEVLIAERRVIGVVLGGEERFAAAEDAGRLRDAFGVAPPLGLPQAYLEPEPHALREVASRYARTHGPFPAGDVARRYAMGEAAVEGALRELLGAGRVVEGEFRPGGSGREWCAPEVLAALRRRSLARLRKEVEPADPAALARLVVDWQGIDWRGPAAGGASRARALRGGPDALLDVVEQLQGAAFPASALERDILPARLGGYRPQDLDSLCAAGEVVWVGLAPLGARDGRIALYLADDLPLLQRPSGDPPKGEAHDRLREHLTRHGASFFAELHDAAGGGLARPVLDALWDLVWAGEVTNDAPGALRAFLSSRPRRGLERRRRLASFRSRREAPPSAIGRWSLVGAGRSAKPPTPTERLVAVSEQLLARHGVLTRDAIAFEDVLGGFGALYPVLRSLEEAGRIRRGYFVAGLGGSQFADPGALERLRALRDTAAEPDDEEVPPAVVLAATDPANPYGAALPWPKTEAVRLARSAETHVVLVDGALAAYLGKGVKEIRTFLPKEEPACSRMARGMAFALAGWAEKTGRSAIGWARADDGPLAESPLAPFLTEAGFVRAGPGFRWMGNADDTAEPEQADVVDPEGQTDQED
jgi:ATP-dependent helicase Lhr and Lhr-like helicase